MADKLVSEVAGIGKVLGERLADNGFDKVRFICRHYFPFFYSLKHGFNLVFQAYVVLGQFLVLKKDKEMFKEWLHDQCQANAKQQTDAATCLEEYCKENL